jgi:hypothetical protein
MADDGIMGMLSGMLGGGAQPAPDPNATDASGNPIAPMAAPAQPSFLDLLKKNGPAAFSGLANQFQNKPAPVPPLPPIQFPQVNRPQVYGSMMPRIGSQ